MFTYPELSPNAEVNFATRMMAKIPVKIFGKRIKEIFRSTKICCKNVSKWLLSTLFRNKNRK